MSVGSLSETAAATGRGSVRIGVDVGGTTVHAVAVGPDDVVLAEHRMPTRRGAEAVVRDIVAAAAAVAPGVAREDAQGASDALSSRGVVAVGLGVPGLVDRRTGRVRAAVNLGLDDVALGPLVARGVGVPVVVENDVNAAALGAARVVGETDSLALLNVGTGIAAGLVHEGRVVRGANGFAGELGHLPAHPTARPCPCGQRGCLETVASGMALSRDWPVASGHPAVDLLAAVRAGRPRAIEVWTRFVDAVGLAAQAVATAYDPAVIVLGGGLSALGEPFRDGVCAALDSRAAHSPFLRSMAVAGRVVLLPASPPVAPLGAAAVAQVAAAGA
ncbi:ROK family protein [Puerhibacterium puerhi]|uniref:ROK family protein n=1 Tax=Puerhibacterium puerhi TaxID=2692623 RepID=UPI0013580527|nr:ROK family protein [Puerhibacterium puerhi]